MHKETLAFKANRAIVTMLGRELAVAQLQDDYRTMLELWDSCPTELKQSVVKEIVLCQANIGYEHEGTNELTFDTVFDAFDTGRE